MPPEKGSLEEFLSGVPREDQEKPIDDLFTPEKGETPEGQEEEAEPKLPRENRESRRLRKRLEESERLGKEMNDRIQELSKARDTDTSNATLDQYLTEVDRIYGTNTPEAREATDILKKSMRGIFELATKTTEERLASVLEAQQQSQQEAVEQAEADDELDSFLDDIEDEYGVDMTSTSKAAETRRQAFFKGLEKYSPKKDGVVVNYADPIAVWEEVVKSARSTQTTRAKEIAGRTSTRSGAAEQQVGQADDSETFRALRDNGIL